MKAYILLKIEVEKEEQVLSMVRGYKDIVNDASLASGRKYNMILEVEVRTPEELHDFVFETLRLLPGVQDTSTLAVMKPVMPGEKVKTRLVFFEDVSERTMKQLIDKILEDLEGQLREKGIHQLCKVVLQSNPDHEGLLQIEIRATVTEVLDACERILIYTLISECEERDISHTLAPPT